ncbi:PREDICTED: PR domain zinc finger protein 8 [Rhagoletis zephyria]|uniref:PR domain zinc finger protein 8 n=1 Tax=Rhagoletis zephyria TaxID=28612 RepID=UPI00081149A3|nr:PREDICTED: PR domain zinc finger protein 8 [Rhagoletis zephyria]
MNMIMDNNHHHNHQQQQQQGTPHLPSPQRADICISTTPPTAPLSPLSNTNSNNDSRFSPVTATTHLSNGKATLKRSFDVAFLMMPDERLKQKHTDKQPRLSEYSAEHHQYPTDLSPRSASHSPLQNQNQQQQSPPHPLINPIESVFNIQEARRYPQITIRSPRIYDDPTLVIPVGSESPESLPLKSAFTKVSSMRLESPVPPAPPLSPDQLSCSSMSPPMSTTPPRTNSGGNGSLSNGSSGNSAPCLNPNIIYQNFRPDYQFSGAFQSVNHVHMLQAQRLKQQLFYRTPLHPTAAAALAASKNASGSASNGGNCNPVGPPPEFLHGYSAFPFPGGHAHPFAAVAPPELPRIAQNPAAAAILTTLIPPTLASTFSLTAQNVCAKCSISFRMTSDLVYHMRSHHKSEVACDPNRRKREEKLRCPVCQETFRERHHLTRHMTAHQDKESDQVTPPNGAMPHGSPDRINNGNGRNHAARISGVSK